MCVCVCEREREREIYIRIDKSSMFCLFLCFECQRDTAHPQLGIKVKEELTKRGKTTKRKIMFPQMTLNALEQIDIKKLVIPQKSNMYCKTKLTSLK